MKPAAAGFILHHYHLCFYFYLAPQVDPFLLTIGGEWTSLLADDLFHSLEALAELAVGVAQGLFRVYMQPASDLGYDKEHIAHLLALVLRGAGLLQFLQFLGQFGKDILEGVKLKAGFGGSLLVFLGDNQGR